MKKSVISLFPALLAGFIACGSGHSDTAPEERRVTMATSHSMDKNDSPWTITPMFGNENTRNLSYVWDSSDKTVATVSMNADKSATVTPLAPGTTLITIQCETLPKLSAQCTLTVTGEPDPIPDDGVMRILAIGNSFSQDGIEQYLWELGDAADVEMVIGNMYIGGSALSQHLTNAGSNAAAYSYRKIVDGVRTETANQRLSTAIADEPWDFISFQEQSGLSGLYTPWSNSLPPLVDWVKGRATNPDAQMIIYQTWAFPQSSTYSGFANYGNDQMTMFNAIVDAVTRAAELVDIEIVVPVGTAIQNGRTSYIGDKFNRDDRHLEVTYGRYTAACTWFEKLTGESVVGNPYFPDTISEHVAGLAQHAAHAAVENPAVVTVLTDYQTPPEIVDTDDPLEHPVYVDFGDQTTPEPWNNVTAVDMTDLQLLDSEGNETGIFLDMTKKFRNVNRTGPKTVTLAGWEDIPSTAISDSYYGHLETFQNQISGPAEITIRSLNKSQKYIFTFFSSRDFSPDSNLNNETAFTVTGTDSDSGEHLYMNAADNSNKTVTSKAVSPDADGNIVIGITAGPNNTRTEKMFFLNAMRIEAAAQ